MTEPGIWQQSTSGRAVSVTEMEMFGHVARLFHIIASEHHFPARHGRALEVRTDL